MPSQSATPVYPFATSAALDVSFDGGRVTCDGRLPWLADEAGPYCLRVLSTGGDVHRQHCSMSDGRPTRRTDSGVCTTLPYFRSLL